MTVDTEYRLLDTLVELYELASAHGDETTDLGDRITKLYRDLVRRPPCVDDFASILDTVFLNKIARIHKAAWIGQHLFGGRPCCVNQKIVLQNGKLISPLIEQAALCGIPSLNADLRALELQWKQVAPWAQLTVDAILVRADKREVIVLKSCSFSQVRRLDSRVSVLHQADTLFEPESQVLRNASVDRGLLGALLFARQVLVAGLPDIRVRLFVVVMADAEGSWNFQCNEVTEAGISDLGQRRVKLDRYPLHATIKDFKGTDGDSATFFDALPGPAKPHSLEQCLDDVVPVDRATRCLMMLREMFHRQHFSTAIDQLAIMSASELAGVVTDKHGIFYPSDQRRHDIEDCLWRGGFIGRPIRSSNSYAIKPKGIARMLVLKPKFNPMIPPFPGWIILNRLRENGGLWQKRGGDAFGLGS